MLFFLKIFFGLLFLIAMGICVFAYELSVYFFGVYLIASFATFIVCGLDKYFAIKSRWRIKEKYLHLMSLFGGWSGALIAQEVFRHKTKKISFQIVFWLTLILNLTFTIYAVIKLIEK